MASADSTAAPDTGATTPSGDTGAASYTIEISVTPDGISVGVESADQENAEEGGSEGAGEAQGTPAAATPVGSIKEALTLALDIYRADGQMPDQNAPSPEDEMSSGFGGSTGASGASSGAAPGGM